MSRYVFHTPLALDPELQRDVCDRLTEVGARVTGIASAAVYVDASPAALERAKAALSAWRCQPVAGGSRAA